MRRSGPRPPGCCSTPSQIPPARPGRCCCRCRSSYAGPRPPGDTTAACWVSRLPLVTQVVHVLVRDQLVGDVELTLAPDRPEEPPHDLLVVQRSHRLIGRPSDPSSPTTHERLESMT